MKKSKKQQKKNNNNNRKFFGRPQRVREDEFPVGSASVFRGRRKGDPDTKSGLGKIVIARAARRKKFKCVSNDSESKKNGRRKKLFPDHF